MTTARSLLTGSTPVKLEYFDIEGVAEPVRLALAISSIPFDDIRISFPQWAAKKPTTKHGVLPEMTLPNGSVITDSMAMLRLAGEADEEGKLYPLDDVEKRLKIEQVVGLVGDLTRAWTPSQYLGMRPQRFGYPADGWVEKEAVVKSVREAFMKEEFPRFMGYFEQLLKEGGGAFLTGCDLTIADLVAFRQISYFTKGIADHIPKDCLASFRGITAWMERVKSHPKVSAYYASKA